MKIHRAVTRETQRSARERDVPTSCRAKATTNISPRLQLSVDDRLAPIFHDAPCTELIGIGGLFIALFLGWKLSWGTVGVTILSLVFLVVTILGWTFLWEFTGPRHRIRTRLAAERLNFGITDQSLSIFIVHSDADPLARAFFQALVAEAFSRRLNVVHYADFSWQNERPVIVHGAPGGSSVSMERYTGDPSAVLRGDVIVIVQTASVTEGMRGELAVLNKTSGRKPTLLVTLAPSKDVSWPVISRELTAGTDTLAQLAERTVEAVVLLTPPRPKAAERRGSV